MARRADNDSADRTSGLIEAAYDAAVEPGAYDRFMAAWGGYLETALGPAAPASTAEVEFDPELASHFRRATRIGENLRKAHALEPTPGSITGQDRRVSLVISVDGTVLAMSQAAIRRFGTLAHLRDFEGALDIESAKRLRSALAARQSAQPGVAVLRTPADRGTDVMFMATSPAPVAGSSPALLVRALKIDWSHSLEVMLAEAFGLSQRETAVVRKLVSGQSLNEIAEIEGRSPATLRTQIKTVFRKTATSSQPDLVRLVATISTVAPFDPLADGEIARVNVGEPMSIKLRDGRRMVVNVHGPANGAPVAFVHGMLDGSGITDRLSQLLSDYRIRLICPVRPAFGLSDPSGDKMAAPETFASDLAEILDRLGIARAAVLGHMAGSVYAFAAASLLPERVSCVLCVSGGVPIVSLRQFNLMKPRQRIVALTARFMPAVLPWILGPGISQIKTGGEWAFMNALYAEAPHDHLVASDPSVFPILRQGYHFTVQQGHLAFETDSAHVTRDWSHYVERTAQPVKLLHGALDPVVHISTVRDFQRRHRHIELDMHADAGQLIFYEYPELVMERLSRLLLGAEARLDAERLSG